jgi:hypothetical protein
MAAGTSLVIYRTSRDSALYEEHEDNAHNKSWRLLEVALPRDDVKVRGWARRGAQAQAVQTLFFRPSVIRGGNR